jgi:formylglycine-generating enzyme required for sulfatase activity
LQPGDVVGGLQVERLLATSEHALTYLVSDPALGTRFVLKECFPEACARRMPDGGVASTDERHDSGFAVAQARFHAECRLAASLEHRNVARVLRFFEAGGTGCCLMTWEAGQSLQERLEQHGPMMPAQVRQLLLGLMSALHYLHERGVWHLAIQPDHVHLSESGEPVLLGFRLAAACQSGEGVTIADTPYRAPEWSTPGATPGPAADIYGLAALAYHCVTGDAPAPAAERAAQLAAGAPDPLQPAAGRSPAGAYAGLTDAIDLGLRLQGQERPTSVADWQKGFTSLDWRRQVAAGQARLSEEIERREWLAPMLLGGILAVLVVVLLYLTFTNKQPLSVPEANLNNAAAPAAIPAEETERWQAALRADTVLGYRRFMEAYPGSVYGNQAGVQLDILDQRNWDELASEDTRPAYRDYLELFPNGLHQSEALRRIEEMDRAEASAERERLESERLEQEAWQQALAASSVAAMDGYLQAWPTGLHAGEARELRRRLRDRALESRAWDSAVKLNQKDAYRAYLDAYPDGEHSAEALINLEHLDLSPGKAFRDCATCPAMRVVPAGAFWQGSAEDNPLASTNEKPRRLVNIPRPLAVGIHEITFAQWDLCVADGACSEQPADNDWGRGDRPVIMVSWNDTQEFVGWLSKQTGHDYRLPSESEWEYFARAGETGDWLGGSVEQVCRYANMAGSETGFRWQSTACADGHALGTTPVGSLAGNAFGLHDVIGNVAEWTDDCMNLSYLDAPSDGSAWGRGICSSHMTRGGSWVTGQREVRLSARFNLDNGDRNDFTGFRVVRTVDD